jgi:hypothetical protein
MEAVSQTTLRRSPHPELGSLDPLVGTWLVEGRHFDTGEPVSGDVTFAWMFNGFYLVQHMALEHGGRSITGVEYIGYDEREGALRSYFFSSEGPSPFGGVALDYVWEARDDGFSVWTGEDGGIAKWEATFANGDTLVGRWEWPGGGYEVTMRRAVARAA